ncbi:MAG: hypothetical protein HUU22_06000 [Phycisphaerae bacterium]|nr:hypothetical protein [Phycisphaerae bacterium]NUQ45566.1 hypothetical protein [Phycisphaerae bacterium]
MNQHFQTLVAQLRADRKKSISLAALSLILFVVWGRALFSGGPDQADAAEAAAPVVTATPTVVAPPAAAAASDAGTPQATADANGAASPSPRAVVIQHMPRVAARELFETNWDAFAPSAEALAEAAQQRPATSQPSPFLTALHDFWANLKKRQEAMRRDEAQIEVDLSRLHLQGTLLGDRARAYINGSWVHEGEIIGGFRLVRVFPREVLLHKSNRNVRVSMP